MLKFGHVTEIVTLVNRILFRMYSRKDMGMGGNQPMFDFAGEAEKAARSVFVGNIPYEATEEQLKSIFSEIGVVLSFRLVYDRETGKPKGLIGNFLIFSINNNYRLWFL